MKGIKLNRLKNEKTKYVQDFDEKQKQHKHKIKKLEYEAGKVQEQIKTQRYLILYFIPLVMNEIFMKLI